MREGTAIPVQRRIDVRPAARIIEPSRVTVAEQKVQPIGVSMPAPRVTVIERGIERTTISAKHADTLRREQIGFQFGSDKWRKVLAREQKRAPRQIRAGEPGRRKITLRIGRAARASGVTARNFRIVETREHSDQSLVVMPR